MATMTIDQAMQFALERHRTGQMNEAEGIYRQILAQQPNHAEALHSLGVLEGQGGKLDVAAELIGRAIALNRQAPLYRHNLGKIFFKSGRVVEAAAQYREALRLSPGEVAILFDLAAALQVMGEVGEAAEVYQQLLSRQSDHPAAWNNLGLAQRSLGFLDEAERSIGEALRRKGDFFDAQMNLGTVYESKGDFARALVCQELASRMNPASAEVYFNKGVALMGLGRFEEAIEAYRKAVAMRGGYVDALSNLGNAYATVKRFDEAIASYQAALAVQPDFQPAVNNLGTACFGQGRHEEAISWQRRAMDLAPRSPQMHSNLLYMLLFLPRYDADTLSREHATWNRIHARPARGRLVFWDKELLPDKKLRIGIVSPDLRDQVIGRNMMPLFANRDRTQAEYYVYHDTHQRDAVTERFHARSDGWRVIASMTDEEVAQKIRDDGIDILVDLSLHMARNRLMVFARKPAPIQVTFAGYPGSTGLDAIDYRLTDPHLDPPGMFDDFYSEKSMRLPSTFWCFDPMGVEVPVNELPARQAGQVTFGSLNNLYKVNPEALALWAKVLMAVPGSRLMMLCGEGSHRARFLEILGKHGVAAERVIFAGNRPRPEYLKLYHQIDIGLDTIPYNGHSTSLDSLWMGVPVVTLVGRTVVGRAGFSQLTNLGLTDLIAHSPEEFVRIAGGLAGDLERLAELRRTLRGRMEKSPLMDGPAFARGIEQAFRQMWRTWCGVRSGR